MKFFFWIFLVATLTMTGAFLLQPGGVDAHFPLGGFSWLVMALVLFIIARRLHLKNVERKGLDVQVKAFAIFFTCFGAFLFIMFLPHTSLLFSHHYAHEAFGLQMNWAYIIGHLFLYLGLAAFIRIPLSLAFPKLVPWGFWFFLALGALTTMVNIFLPNTPVFHHPSGLTLLGANPLVGALVAINVTLAWVPAGIYFIWSGIASQDSFVRMRGLLLGSGLLITTIGGPLHDIVESALMFLIADVVTILGVVVIASGVFLTSPQKQLQDDITSNV